MKNVLVHYDHVLGTSLDLQVIAAMTSDARRAEAEVRARTRDLAETATTDVPGTCTFVLLYVYSVRAGAMGQPQRRRRRD